MGFLSGFQTDNLRKSVNVCVHARVCVDVAITEWNQFRNGFGLLKIILRQTQAQVPGNTRNEKGIALWLLRCD